VTGVNCESDGEGYAFTMTRPALSLLAALAVLLLARPEAAWCQPQGSAIRVQVSTEPNTVNEANIGECTSDGTSFWTWMAPTTISTPTNFQLSASDTATCATIASFPISPSYTLDIFPGSSTTSSPPSSISTGYLASLAGVTCDTGADTTVNICLTADLTGNLPLTVLYSDTFTFQLAIPPVPTITSVSANDSSLTVNVEPGTATFRNQAVTGVTYSVVCTPVDTPATTSPSQAGQNTGPAGPITVGGLTNGVPYTVTAQGFSWLGNSGPVSAPFLVGADTTPVAGRSSGCGTGEGGVAGLAGLLAFLSLRRRSPRARTVKA